MTQADAPEAVFSERDGVGWVHLNRPHRLNAMTNRLIADVSNAVSEVERRDDLKAFVLTGSGRGFCSGADTSTLFDAGDYGPLDQPKIQELTGRIFRMSVPTIAAVNGPAAGAGFELSLAFDIRIAAEPSFFQHAAMKNNLVAGDGSTFFLPRMIGLSRSLDLLLTERRVNAQEALEIGLVASVVPSGELEHRAQELARTLAQTPEAVTMTKEAIRIGLGAGDPDPVFAYLRLAVAQGRAARARTKEP